MLIVNGYGFQGNPASDPQLLHGFLDPSVQYSDPLLLGAAPGSIYISRWVKTDSNCQLVDSGACLWVKVKKGTDCCNGLGGPKDWVRCCCFKLLEGTTAPNGAVEPWCGAQRGDYYLQQDAQCGTQVWLKIRDGCSAADWLNLNDKSSCVVVGNGAPTAVTLCDQPKGAFYVDTADSCRVYVKLFDNCTSTPAVGTCADWLPISLKLTQVQDIVATTNRRITLDAVTQVVNVPKAIYGRRQKNNLNQVIPGGVKTKIAGMTQIVADSTSVDSAMCPVGGMDSEIAIPVTGFYNITAIIAPETSSTDHLGFRIMADDTINLGGTSNDGNPTISGAQVCYSLLLSPRTAGQKISIYAETSNPAGITVEHASLAAILVE